MPKQRTLTTSLRYGLACRCPRCGKGKLYETFLTIRPQCDVCGLSLEGHDTGDGPAYIVLSLVSILAVIAALVVEIVYEPALWLHAALWVPFILVSSIVLLIYTKSLFVALQYHYRTSEFTS